MTFTEELHPRLPKGSAGGGEFGKSGKSPSGGATHPGPGGATGKSHGLKSTLAYNAKTKHGSGYGVKGGDHNVRLLQEALNKLGVTDSHGHKLAVDGQLGPLTTQAIEAAQRRLGLKADGRVSPELFDRLLDAKSLPGGHHVSPQHHTATPHATPHRPAAHHAAPKPKPKPKTPAKPLKQPAHMFARSEQYEEEPMETETAPVEIPQTYQRTFGLDGIEIRRGGDGRTVEAYAAVFGVKKEIRDQHGHYIEKISPSAFNRTIGNGSAMRSLLLYNHGFDARGKTGGNQQVPLGKVLEVRADGRGLLTVARYKESDFADEVLASIRNGDITAQSFEGPIFRSNPARTPKTGGRDIPTVERLELGLRNFGPTPTPYYAEAEITAVRSMDELAADFAALDEEQREELIRTLSTTPGWDPETATILATPRGGPGAEDSRDAHSMRQKKIRLMAEIRARSL